MNHQTTGQEIKAIQAELRQLKKEFMQRVDALEHRLGDLNGVETAHFTDNQEDNSSGFCTPNDSDPDFPNQPTYQTGLGSTQEAGSETKYKADGSSDSALTPQQTVQSTDRKPVAKGLLTLGIQLILHYLTIPLGPFSAIVKQAYNSYQHYRREGKGPVFFLTVAGILALVAGFGYLLQYSFNNYLGDVGKVVLGYLVANALIVVGAKLSRKSASMAEFSASLIGLGIILNYLNTYFVSGYYELVGASIGLVMLSAICFGAYWLARFFAPRTMAVISLVGGATTPLFLNNAQDATLFYFIYLLIIVAGAVKLSAWIRWPMLAEFAMTISVIMIEYLLLVQSDEALIDNIFITLALHGFFYLFAVHSLLQLIEAKDKVTNNQLIALSGNLLFFLLVLYQIQTDDAFLGGVYLANAIPFSILFFYNPLLSFAEQRLRSNVNSILLLHSGMLIGFAVLLLIDPALLGAVWGIEGLIFLFLGFRFALPFIRMEGYTALLAGLVQMTLQMTFWLTTGLGQRVNSKPTWNFDSGWGNLMLSGAFLFGLVFLMRKYKDRCLTCERHVLRFAQETQSIWILSAYLFTVGALNFDLFWISAVVPMFYLLFRAFRHKLRMTEYLALGQYFLLVIAIFVAAAEVQSIRFGDQNAYGLIARAEAFVSLWLIAAFYRRFMPNSGLAPLAHRLHQIFYVIIPLGFLPSVLRNLPQYFVSILWISASISLFLHTKVKFKVLRIEMYGLIVVAWALSVLLALTNYFQLNFTNPHFDFLEKGNGILALSIGLVFFIAVTSLFKGFAQTKFEFSRSVSTEYGWVFRLVYYYLGMIILLAVFIVSGQFSMGLLLAGYYFAVLLWFWPRIVPVRQDVFILFRFAITLVITVHLTELTVATGIHLNSWSPILTILATSLYGGLIHYPLKCNRVLFRLTKPRKKHIWSFHALVVHSYILAIAHWMPSQMRFMLSILLVIHATLVLMLTLKPLYRPLIKVPATLFGIASLKILVYDLDGFTHIQKIIAFMFIGAMLLGASYFYQKIMDKEQEVLV